MKFYGEVGYGNSVEDPVGSGTFVDSITEFAYFGEIVRNNRRLDDGSGLNDNVVISNSISIIADEYAHEHFFDIKYARWNGVLWTVTSVEVRSPRLVLTIGSVYNGPTP